MMHLQIIEGQNARLPFVCCRFGDWVAHTSPYAGQKTPPSVAMKSVAAGVENTPPAQHPVHITGMAYNAVRIESDEWHGRMTSIPLADLK